MDSIEFDTLLGNEGTIHIPEQYRRLLKQDKPIHVILTPPRSTRRPGEDIIEYYLKHPITSPKFEPPTREALHERGHE